MSRAVELVYDTSTHDEPDTFQYADIVERGGATMVGTSQALERLNKAFVPASVYVACS